MDKEDLWGLTAFAISISCCNQGGCDSLYRVVRYICSIIGKPDPPRCKFESLETLTDVFPSYKKIFCVKSMCDLNKHLLDIKKTFTRDRPYIKTNTSCKKHHDIKEGGHNGFNRIICGSIWWEIMYITSSQLTYNKIDTILWYRFIGDLVSLFPCKKCRKKGKDVWLTFLKRSPSLLTNPMEVVNNFHKRCHGSDKMVEEARDYYVLRTPKQYEPITTPRSTIQPSEIPNAMAMGDIGTEESS